jgi:hypothetical protein
MAYLGERVMSQEPWSKLKNIHHKIVGQTIFLPFFQGFPDGLISFLLRKVVNLL